MSTLPVRALRAPLVLMLLAGLAPAALAQGSVTTLSPEASGASPSVATLATPQARAEPADPRACALALHARLREIREGPYAALRALGMPAPAAEAAVPEAGGIDAPVFAAAPRARGEDEARALRTAAALGRGGPAGTFAPMNSDARWVAARLREDLGDYLNQKPTDFLCAGTAPYLAMLRRQAERLGASPARFNRDLVVQREAARRDLATALRALKPAPVPTPAPARGEAAPLAEAPTDLRSSVGLAEETMGPPAPATLVATRAGATRISEGGFDPDLPPLARRPEWRLESQGDILAAIDRLATAAAEAGLFAPALAQGTDAITTGTVTSETLSPETVASGDPVRRRLVGLKALAVASPAMRPDGATAQDVAGAFASLEALDRLRAAATRPAAPLPAAFEATFAAIERAREESGRAAP